MLRIQKIEARACEGANPERIPGSVIDDELLSPRCHGRKGGAALSLMGFKSADFSEVSFSGFIGAWFRSANAAEAASAVNQSNKGGCDGQKLEWGIRFHGKRNLCEKAERDKDDGGE
jgi:hypothetical protein